MWQEFLNLLFHREYFNNKSTWVLFMRMSGIIVFKRLIKIILCSLTLTLLILRVICWNCFGWCHHMIPTLFIWKDVLGFMWQSCQFYENLSNSYFKKEKKQGFEAIFSPSFQIWIGFTDIYVVYCFWANPWVSFFPLTSEATKSIFWIHWLSWEF